jgi:hypothetical protein
MNAQSVGKLHAKLNRSIYGYFDEGQELELSGPLRVIKDSLELYFPTME